jgi:hypothetical protein
MKHFSDHQSQVFTTTTRIVVGNNPCWNWTGMCRYMPVYHTGSSFCSLGFFWGSWVWNGVHSASWSDKLSSYLNKEIMVRFGKLKMQLWDSMCWPHVNPVASGAVGKDCQRRLLSRPRFVRACSAMDLFLYKNNTPFFAKLKNIIRFNATQSQIRSYTEVIITVLSCMYTVGTP